MGEKTEARLRRLLAALTPRQRAELLDALTRAPTQRAQTIGKLYLRPEAQGAARRATP